MARTRTTKKLAQRIDLNYFKRPTSLKRAKLYLSILLPALAVAWIAWRGAARDNRVFSSGRMSAAHAVLEKECAACHLQQAGAFSAKAADSACLSCHDGPIHHANQSFTPSCVTCHTEHRGRIKLVATRDQSCAECHGNLKTKEGGTRFSAAISDFEVSHPEFAAVRNNARDLGAIKLNHAIHMRQIRRGPIGPIVQLECSDCHRPSAVTASWPYADARYAAAMPAYAQQNTPQLSRSISLPPRTPATGREFMAPPKFSTACASCHLLTFDKRFDEGVPHDKTEIVHAFVMKKFTEYIAAHPAELRVMREPNRDLTGKPIPPSVRVLTPAQWIAEKTAEAETLLWRKTCKQCHTLTNVSEHAASSDTLTAYPPLSALLPPGTKSDFRSQVEAFVSAIFPLVASANIMPRWMPHAKFDHEAHRGFACESCHQKALTSTETSDVLIPGIATCRTCHAPGPSHAESRCFECHSYHDWSKRKEVTPKFTLPSLRTGGS